MTGMRKFLYGLMMMIMLTPGLVCGPFMAAGKAHAASMQMPHCHHMAMDRTAGSTKSPHDGTMMFKDCARIDLYGADHSALEKPDLKITKVFYDAAAAAIDYDFKPVAYYQIRGPPPETARAGTTYPPLYLTTQRLRV